MIDKDRVRARLAALIAENDETLASMSKFIGRNTAYLHQFVHRGSPKTLAEDDRLKLAQYFGVDERELGARDPWTP